MEKNEEYNKVAKYLHGYREADEPQVEVKSGDPQAAALIQYLKGKIHLTQNRIIVDFGSGRGLLAKVMELVWTGHISPRYFAVDLPEPLATLSLPPRIHNVSRKIDINDFYSFELSNNTEFIDVVILRNVLHELDISDTARLFTKLGEHLRKDTEIYIQDMVNLPRAERGRAGWHPEILSSFLEEIGADTHYFPLKSFSGIEWYALTAKFINFKVDYNVVAEACIKARQRQKDYLLEEINKLLSNKQDSDVFRLTQLNNDFTAIETQIMECRQSLEQIPAETEFPLRKLGIPTFPKSTFGPIDYAVEADDPIRIHSGLVALLSHKRILDLSRLLSSCKSFINFAGYSQRSLFEEEETRATLYNFVEQGKHLKIIVCNPDLLPAKLRASEPVYVDQNQLINDIRFTLHEAQSFFEVLSNNLGADVAADRFQVKVTGGIPYASYFIADNLCFMSMYSKTMSGTRAPCLVFKEIPKAGNNYYNTLRQDFLMTWNEAIPALVGKQ